jgi:hypothetical protein
MKESPVKKRESSVKKKTRRRRTARRGAAALSMTAAMVGSLQIADMPAAAACDQYTSNYWDTACERGYYYDAFWGGIYFDPFFYDWGYFSDQDYPPPIPILPSPLSPPELVLYQKVPNVPEAQASGAITAPITPGSPGYADLVFDTNPDIVYKDEENGDGKGTGNDNTDHQMTRELQARLAVLAASVKVEFPGLRLRVTEAFDLDGEHSAAALHYEGRAADITVSDLDQAKLGRLAQLAVDAGLDWVLYEDTQHVHVSVGKPPPPPDGSWPPPDLPPTFPEMPAVPTCRICPLVPDP